MKNNIKIKRKVEDKFEIVKKVPKDKIQNSLKLYNEYGTMKTLVKNIFLLNVVFIVIHNIFIAKKRYDYEVYNNIRIIETSIIGVLIILVVIITIIAMSKNSKVKNELKEISKRYGIKKEVVQEEFSVLAMHLYGGRGVVLK
ncbi:hypothetical protein ACSIGC_17695 [Tenacibaculum sp. ZS6-P6]|uniref:hypothetical protein n=1 Tax=Tenacibaculum sp. ZS6-P6 TaxID=3447503 RepID=UPI003F945E42